MDAMIKLRDWLVTWQNIPLLRNSVLGLRLSATTNDWIYSANTIPGVDDGIYLVDNFSIF